jgi:hypothetical protein
MANLIEQMNVLKGLDDSALQGEIQSPSGAAPPFLVLTELSRRKDMRQRYEGEKARQKPSTTVVEDISFGLPAQPASMQGGLNDAMDRSTQGFAAGGLVEAVPGYADGGAVDYADIAARYNERLSGLGADKDRARALALLAASGAIMGGGSSNTLSNIGGGISAFAGSYGDQLKGIDSEELALLRGITDIGQAQSQMDLAQIDADFRERQLASQEKRDAARLDFDKKPASVVEAEWLAKQTPEVQAQYRLDNPAYNPNAETNELRKLDDANRAFDNALKSLPEPMFTEPGREAEVARERQKQAALLAYPKWVALLGEAAATAMARQYGVADGDLVLATSPGAVVDEKDPLGLGL